MWLCGNPQICGVTLSSSQWRSLRNYDGLPLAGSTFSKMTETRLCTPAARSLGVIFGARQFLAMHAPPQVGQIFIDGRASLYMLKRSTFSQKGLLSPHKRATLPQRPTYSEKGPLPPRKGPLSSQKGHFPPPQKKVHFPHKEGSHLLT